MGLYDNYYLRIPEYCKYMYLQGYSAYDILSSTREEMLNRQIDAEDDTDIVILKTEVNVK